MPLIDAETLDRFVVRIFVAADVPEDEARVVSANLVGANLRGHDSHGVLRVIQYVDFLQQGVYQTGVPLRVENEGPAVVVCDGGWGLGQVQAHRLLDLIVPKARAVGIAAGTARSCGHIGRLGDYAERAAGLGLVLIATVNNDGSGQRVAPPGGLAGRLGTNPLCAAVPLDGEPPVVLDFGTSVVAEGKVRAHYLDGRRPVPPGWLLDSSGEPTTDPAVLYEPPLGTILPMGGDQAYKGFGLSLVLDLLAGGLTGGRSAYEGAPTARGNNVVFVLLDPGHFAGSAALAREATAAVGFVRSGATRPGVASITLPGDPERAALARRSADGIPIDPGHWDRLIDLAGRLGVEVPSVGG